MNSDEESITSQLWPVMFFDRTRRNQCRSRDFLL